MLGTILSAALTVGANAPDAGTTAAQSYWLYVAAESADEIYVVRYDAGAAAAEIETVIDVGYMPTEIEGPHGLTMGLDGRHWYLTMAHGKPYGLLYKFKTGTNELVGEAELGLFPATMQISVATGLLYCVNFDLHGDMSPSTVSVVDPDEMVEVARTETGPMPHGSRISPDGMRHYSCAMMTGELFEIDTTTFELVRKLDLDAMPMDGMKKPAAAGHGAATGGHGQASDKKPMDMAKHGMSKPTWVFPHPSKPFVYVCLNGQAEVVEVSLEKWMITRRFKTGKGPYNVEVTPDGKKMVVSYKSAAAVGIWDLVEGKELAVIESTRKVTHGVVISPDGKYAFVSNEGIGGQKGTLDVFDLEKNERTATIDLGLQMGGITFWKTEERE